MHLIQFAKRVAMVTFLIAGYAIALLHLFAQAGASAPTAPYLDPGLPIDQRVDDLVSRMTLEEKASQLVNQARAIPRLQVPAYDYWSEGLHGVARAGFATVFPQAIGARATWDAPLLHDVATVIGTEARAKHHEAVRQGRRDIFEGLTFWSPNINIFRDPRWGRGQETYGEDPFLTARMGVAFVTGLQGDDPKYLTCRLDAQAFRGAQRTRVRSPWRSTSPRPSTTKKTPTCRHSARPSRGQAASRCAPTTASTASPPAQTASCSAISCAGLGFDGFVVSDCGAVLDIWSGHHFSKTKEEAAAVSAQDGHG